jgi:putative endopeptidase
MKYIRLLPFALPFFVFAQPKPDPCVDFYQYACSGWMATNPIPSDRSRWVRFSSVAQHTDEVLLEILQKAAVSREGRSPTEAKIGDAYAACMDTTAIAQNGLRSLQPELQRILDIQDRRDLLPELARLHRIGINSLFRFGSVTDAKDSTRTIAGLSQAGLSLPNRTYYLKTDVKSVEIRQRFVLHVTHMFTLAGDAAENAPRHAQMVLDLETGIAKAMADTINSRDPNKSYHIMTKAQLAALAPQIAWDAYFKEVGAPGFETLNVGQPEYIGRLGVDLGEQSLEAWRSYFSFQLLRAFATQIGGRFDSENFDFWSRYLNGAKQPRPREERCVEVIDRMLPDLLGQKYIEVAFSTAARDQINQMIAAIEKAMAADIRQLPWMTEATKKAALAKLQAINNNMAFPAQWRDYSKVTIARDDFLGNSMRAAQILYDQRLEKIGKPTNRAEWSISTPTVDAYYSAQNNTITFPAGVMQSPIFDANRDAAYNLGSIGTVIGHELTHGFDDTGRKFDGDGNLRDWWTATDGAEFEKRAACLVNQYSAINVVPGVNVNGRMTLGENTADNGGVRIALMALKEQIKDATKVDGLTPEQRFFTAYAQVWCENATTEDRRSRALNDNHSPNNARVNAVLQNMPEFREAFSCKTGQPMVRENACRVW